MEYFLITFGCQMNKSDSERIASALEKKGYKPASEIKEADLIVVNMCSVRQSAVDRVYGLLSKFKKIKAKTILTGCVLKKDRAKLLKEFDEVVDIKDLVKQIGPKYENKFSASVPIMTGCNNFCTFCVVPYARGKEVSRPAKEIICEVKNLVNPVRNSEGDKKTQNKNISNGVKNGYKEIWLLGQNVNSYQYNFPKLLRKINKIPGKFSIKFTSSHPKDFSDDLISAMAGCKKVAKYLNLPVQSGDDKILKKMNRPYIIKQYKNLVKKIREKIPNIALSTDVIVGFPGETKKQFENTAKLFREIKYDMAYINKYSPRPGTKGAKLTDNVPAREKKRREKVLTEILKETALENNKKYIGKIVEILPIEYKDQFLIGKSFHYKTVKFKGKKNLIGKFVKVKIIDALAWGLKGKYVK